MCIRARHECFSRSQGLQSCGVCPALQAPQLGLQLVPPSCFSGLGALRDKPSGCWPPPPSVSQSSSPLPSGTLRTPSCPPPLVVLSPSSPLTPTGILGSFPSPLLLSKCSSVNVVLPGHICVLASSPHQAEGLWPLLPAGHLHLMTLGHFKPMGPKLSSYSPEVSLLLLDFAFLPFRCPPSQQDLPSLVLMFQLPPSVLALAHSTPATCIVP